MRVVIDTNVFVSGVFFSGPPYQILNAWRDSKIHLVLSSAILEEYHRVAKSLSDRFPEIDMGAILNLVTEHSDIIPAPERTEPICQDPDDDKFISCAIAGNAEFIISGDRHLLKVNGYKGIHIIRPRKFVDYHIK